MIIASAESRVETLPLSRPYTIAFRSVDCIQTTLVILRDAVGHTGLGAASPEIHVTGESNEACATALGSPALAWLIGAQVGDWPRLASELALHMPDTPAARAAVDMALLDLWAQSLGLPLVDALGRAHQALPTSITIGIKSADETVREAHEHLARGFRVLKIKLGHDLEQDVDRLTLLRARVGPQITLRVDPNQGYDLAQLERFFQATEVLNLEFVEQPVPVALTDGLRTLPTSQRERVALDEALLTPADALRWSTPPLPAGIFNIKLMKCGGIVPARRIAAVAEAAGVALMWGCMDESCISIAAALHAALSSPGTRYLDLDGSFDLSRDPARGGFRLDPGGIMSTLDEPGLGVHLQDDP